MYEQPTDKTLRHREPRRRVLLRNVRGKGVTCVPGTGRKPEPVPSEACERAGDRLDGVWVFLHDRRVVELVARVRLTRDRVDRRGATDVDELLLAGSTAAYKSPRARVGSPSERNSCKDG